MAVACRQFFFTLRMDICIFAWGFLEVLVMGACMQVPFTGVNVVVCSVGVCCLGCAAWDGSWRRRSGCKNRRRGIPRNLAAYISIYVYCESALGIVLRGCRSRWYIVNSRHLVASPTPKVYWFKQKVSILPTYFAHPASFSRHLLPISATCREQKPPTSLIPAQWTGTRLRRSIRLVERLVGRQRTSRVSNSFFQSSSNSSFMFHV